MKGALAAMLTMIATAAAAAAPPIPVAAARVIFARRHALCSADGGRLWGVSLCGPLMLADPKTHVGLVTRKLQSTAKFHLIHWPSS